MLKLPQTYIDLSIVQSILNLEMPVLIVQAHCPCGGDALKSPAMIKHSLMVIARVVGFLNPGQTPVLTFDQPLYAIDKGPMELQESV